MERLQRLQALGQAKASAAQAGPAARKRVVARVVHVDAAHEAAAKEEAVRAELKAMALQRQQEAERNRLEDERLARLRTAELGRQRQAELQRLIEDSASGGSEGSSEDEHAQPLLKPVFVAKEHRQTVREGADPDEEHRRQQEEKQREAHALLADHVRIESAAAAKRKEAELEATSGAFDPRSVDDTDDLDEAAEAALWKLRELLRIKRERGEREAREREQIEMERVRNLTEAEKQQIDREKALEFEANEPKGEYRFLQKYYHKGAFFTDDAAATPLLARDYAQPTGEDRFNKEILPEAMQVKNFGKRSRSKWTHLTNEDTTEFTSGWGERKNQANYRAVSRMGGMRGDLSRPSKTRKRDDNV